MKTVYTDDHRLQDGKSELIDGKLVPCFEMPKRADIILARVRAAKLGEVVAPEDFGLDPVRRVHKANFVEFLRTAWDEWVKAHGAYDALPLNWLARGMRSIEPEAIDGRLGFYSFDAGTPITAGTWRAAAAASVSSEQVNAAWIPTMPPPPAARNRRFSSIPRRAPSEPCRSVTP